MRAVLLLLALLQPAPPFTATWQGNHTARLSWTQPADVALTCLYRQTTLIRCWQGLDAGATYTTIGDRGPLDAAAHPRAGDTYTLDQDGNAQQQTRLGWALWIAEIKR